MRAGAGRAGCLTAVVCAQLDTGRDARVDDVTREATTGKRLKEKEEKEKKKQHCEFASAALPFLATGQL